MIRIDALWLCPQPQDMRAGADRLLNVVINTVGEVHVLRDPTRGGLATTLNEIAEQSQVSIVLDEASVPVHEAVRTHGQVRIVTEEQHMMSLQRLGGLVVERLQEFQQPGRKHLFLLSVNAKT